jgi:putative ABC transport system substrate-binding protein
VRRREFITLLGGAAAAWPLAARAQQPNPIRQIGMLVGFDDPDIKAFQQELRKLGWLEGRNIHIEQRRSSCLSTKLARFDLCQCNSSVWRNPLNPNQRISYG